MFSLRDFTPSVCIVFLSVICALRTVTYFILFLFPKTSVRDMKLLLKLYFRIKPNYEYATDILIHTARLFC